MIDLLIAFLFGALIGPLVGWVLGVFNPIGYFGVPPWKVPTDRKIKPVKGDK